MFNISAGDFITIAVGSHEIRARVEHVYAPPGVQAKYLVVSHGLIDFVDWITESQIINTNKRTRMYHNVG